MAACAVDCWSASLATRRYGERNLHLRILNIHLQTSHPRYALPWMLRSSLSFNGIGLSFLIHVQGPECWPYKIKISREPDSPGGRAKLMLWIPEMTKSSRMSPRFLQSVNSKHSLLFCVTVATIFLFRGRHLLSYNVNVRVRPIRFLTYQISWFGSFSLVIVRLCLEKMIPRWFGFLVRKLEDKIRLTSLNCP